MPTSFIFFFSVYNTSYTFCCCFLISFNYHLFPLIVPYLITSQHLTSSACLQLAIYLYVTLKIWLCLRVTWCCSSSSCSGVFQTYILKPCLIHTHSIYVSLVSIHNCPAYKFLFKFFDTKPGKFQCSQTWQFSFYFFSFTASKHTIFHSLLFLLNKSFF